MRRQSEADAALIRIRCATYPNEHCLFQSLYAPTILITIGIDIDIAACINIDIAIGTDIDIVPKNT